MHGATPLCDAIAAVRDRRVSVVDLADNALNAIAERNADLRAFVFVDAPDVRAQARAIDARIRSGAPTGPLAGALIAVKDVIDVKGWPTLANSRTRARVPASRDAECVSRLREADAVLLGKTVTPEMQFGAHWNDLPFPPARHPSAPDRYTGNSSGGSAVAVAAGLAHAALGTDTIGSLRLPAAAVGCCAFIPSHGRLPSGGVLPLAPDLDRIGALALGTPDLEIIAHGLLAQPRSSASEASLAGLRLGVPWNLFRPLAGTDLLDALDRLLSCAGKAGAAISSLNTRPLPFYQDVATTLALAGLRQQVCRLPESQQRELGTVVSTLFEQARRIDDEQLGDARRRKQEVKGEFSQLTADIDVILMPTMAGETPLLSELTAEFLADIPLLTAPFSLSGLPVVALPIAASKNRLPLGIQIAGSVGADLDLLRAAWALEACCG